MIVRVSKHSGSCRGGDEIFLLCEKVNKGEFCFSHITDKNSDVGSEFLWHLRNSCAAIAFLFSEDIEVRFYEEASDGVVTWEGRGEFGQNDVHRQFAIVFKTPPYRRGDISHPVTVYMQLRRTSDGETSDPTPFQFTPENLGKNRP